MASWLNTAFSGLDGAVFTAFNSIQCGFLNFFCKFYSLIGEKGLGFIIISLVLMLFKNTRKIGFCCLLSIAVGALFTNIIIKNAVARPRPYMAQEQYNAFWQLAGGIEEGEFSFPSGHTTASFAFAIGLFASCNKKWSWVALPFALIMGLCRIYLVVHYTTDVIAGIIVGTVAGVISFYVTKVIYNWLENNYDKKLCRFVLQWSVKKLFQKKSQEQ